MLGILNFYIFLSGQFQLSVFLTRCAALAMTLRQRDFPSLSVNRQNLTDLLMKRSFLGVHKSTKPSVFGSAYQRYCLFSFCALLHDLLRTKKLPFL